MQNAWMAGSAVAVVSAVVGFFVVLRGASFVAHAVPRGSFAGAAGAVLVGQSSLLGLGLFALLSSLGIALLGRRRRGAVATALVLVAALGLGDLFLSIGNVYAPEVFALLFGQVVGISRADVYFVGSLALAVVLVVAWLYRPLLMHSVSAEVAEVRGLRPVLLDGIFLLLVAAAATATVPVVGALLAFSLMVGPAAAASLLAKRPSTAVFLSIALALVSVWISLWLAYITSWPIGFYVSAWSLVAYLAVRLGQASRRGRTTLAQSDGALKTTTRGNFSG